MGFIWCTNDKKVHKINWLNDEMKGEESLSRVEQTFNVMQQFM